MPSGIILSSASHGTDEERQAAVEKVLTDNGYEPDKPEAEAAGGEQQEAELVEPKREDFKTDEEFEAAQEEFEQKEDEAAEKAEEEAERKRLAALPKKSRRQKAVEKATKELRDELRKANERLAALESGKKPAAAAEKVEEPKQPKRDDFKTDQEFEDAMFDYRYKLRRAREEAESQQNRLKESLTKNFKDYQDSVAAFKEEHDDWEKVVNQSIAIPEAVYYAIVDLAEKGPAVTYHLGKHPEILEDLAQLTPYRAAIEIGRLADKLGGKSTASAEKPKTQKPKPNLPEPVKPVSTAAATSSTLSSKEAAQKRDYRAFKAAQRRGA